MKKLLGIIVLGLLLSGCSKKPEKIIENCADKKFDWFPNMIVLDKEFNKNKKFVKLNNSLKTVKSSKEMAAKNFKEYSFSNFDLSENDMKYLTNTIVLNVLRSATDKNYKKKLFPKFIYQETIKKSGEANKDNEKINKAGELFYFYQTKYQNDNRLVDEYMDYTGETFNKFKLKIKLLDKKYEVTFKRCEAIRDDSPLAFDAKWK